MDEYLDRVFEAIKSNTELENLQEGIGMLRSISGYVVVFRKRACYSKVLYFVKRK